MLLSNGTELAYRVRVHPRARHVRIVISRRHGLVITIPRGFNQDRIPGILEQKRAWIERVLSRLPMKLEPYRLPERIALAAIGEEWTVEYRQGEHGHAVLSSGHDPKCQTFGSCPCGGSLVVRGAIDHPEVVRQILESWLRVQAKRHLVPWLHRTATELGFEVRGVTVRTQRTLWGSCSHRHTISLNARLLLLPPDLVHYILVHELVHIRHPNHSRRFWQAVAVYVPDYRDKLRALRHRMESLAV